MARLSGLLLVAGISVGCGETSVVIASKNFTEQNILAEILAQELEGHGVSVERRFHLGGTFVCHNAIIGDQVDLYIEYTGTALTAILERPPVQDPDSVYRMVERAYSDEWELVWGPPLGFENTFALVVRSADADSLGLRTIGDLERVAERWTAGFGPEFMARKDGYPGLQEAYGVRFGAVRQMDLGLMYRALSQGEIDVAVGNSTDGQINALSLIVLEDDRDYFPPYQAAPVARREVLGRFPAVESTMRDLAGALSEDEMRELNRQVDVEGEDVTGAVRRWRESRVDRNENRDSH